MKQMTKKNAPLVLARFMTWFLQQDKQTQADACASVNVMLDDMRDGDCFGTEGQNDPRGDQR